MKIMVFIQNSMLYLVWITCISVIHFPALISSATMNDTKTLHRDLLSDYNINVRPIVNQDEPVIVTISLAITSIQSFDEVREMFSFIGAFFIYWQDDGMAWDPNLYGSHLDTVTSYKQVWVPEIILINPSDEVGSIGMNWQRVRYDYNGSALWAPGGLFKAACKVNVLSYPFDIQTCSSHFVAWGYSQREIQFIAQNKEISMTYYSENGAWTIEKTSVDTAIFSGSSEIIFTVVLKRKAMYIIVNVCLPILFLSILNLFVFVLVPESGERVSYCITVLLSIAVFLTIISDTLPKTSEPVPIISYKLMADMIISSLITLITIINLRLYYSEDEQEVPALLQTLYITFQCLRCRKNKIVPAARGTEITDDLNKQQPSIKKRKESLKTITVMENPNQDPPDAFEKRLSLLISAHEDANEEKITWKKISAMIDCASLILFSVATLGSFVVFFIVTST